VNAFQLANADLPDNGDAPKKRELVRNALQDAINLADASQAQANFLFEQFKKTKDPIRQRLAKELGFDDPNNITQEDFEKGMKSDQKDKWQQLGALQIEWMEIQQLRGTSAETRAQAADILAGGYLDAAPNAPPDQQLHIKNENTVEALNLIGQAKAIFVSQNIGSSSLDAYTQTLQAAIEEADSHVGNRLVEFTKYVSATTQGEFLS
jgi:hypothetical protein